MSLLVRASSVAVAVVTQSVLSLLLSVLLARSLGPSGRGVYAIVTLTALLAGALGTLGFSAGATVRAGRAPSSVGGLLTASLILAACAGLLLCPAVNGLYVVAGSRIFSGVPQHAFFLASLAIPALVLASLLSGILAGLGCVARVAWLSAGSVAVQVALTSIVVVLFEKPLASIVAVFAIGPAMLSAALYVELKKHASLRPRDPRPALRGVVAFSLRVYLADLVHLLHLRLDVFIVKVFLNPYDVGLYALSQAVCEWIWLVPRSAATTLMPAVASSTNELGVAHTARAARVLLLVSGGATLLLGAVAGWLIPLLFGAAFSGSVGPLRLLLPGIWAGSVTGILSAYLTGSGHAGYPLANTVASTLLNLMLNMLLVPRYGICGAAMASSASYILSLLINVAFVVHVADLGLRDLFVVRREDLTALARPVADSAARFLGRFDQ